jgi:galactarate dehydratase
MSSRTAIAANAEKPTPVAPHAIRMDERDNVAIVANAGGLEAGSTFATGFAAGLVLRERVPQAHKVALVDIGEGEPVLRYGIPIGYALKAIVAGSWVHERLLRMPAARSLDGLPMATAKRAPPPPLEASPSRAFRNADGSVGTATSWRSPPPCSASPAWSSSRWRGSRPSCCRSIRTSTTWSAWSTPTAAA